MYDKFITLYGVQQLQLPFCSFYTCAQSQIVLIVLRLLAFLLADGSDWHRHADTDNDVHPCIAPKKQKRECNFQREWKSHGMIPSARWVAFARCKYCNTDINIVHEGINNIKKHVATSKHWESVKAAGCSGNVKAFLKSLHQRYMYGYYGRGFLCQFCCWTQYFFYDCWTLFSSYFCNVSRYI